MHFSISPSLCLCTSPCLHLNQSIFLCMWFCGDEPKVLIQVDITYCCFPTPTACNTSHAMISLPSKSQSCPAEFKCLGESKQKMCQPLWDTLCCVQGTMDSRTVDRRPRLDRHLISTSYILSVSSHENCQEKECLDLHSGSPLLCLLFFFAERTKLFPGALSHLKHSWL